MTRPAESAHLFRGEWVDDVIFAMLGSDYQSGRLGPVTGLGLDSNAESGAVPLEFPKAQADVPSTRAVPPIRGMATCSG